MQKIGGFSLVELSIVLVILGLLTGGILAGQSLIHAAELRKTMQEPEKYLAAMHTFRDKYFGWPGDITNANAFWPSASNGNGDGVIEAATIYGSSYTSPDSTYYDGERPQFFMQLALAGLVEGNFDGSATLGKGYPSIPASPSQGEFVTGKWDSGNTGNTAVPNAQQSLSASVYLAMTIANPANFNVSSTFNDSTGIFTPEDAWNMDTKKDDGLPASGSVVAHGSGAAAACTDSGTHLTYNVANSNKYCGLYWELAP